MHIAEEFKKYDDCLLAKSSYEIYEILFKDYTSSRNRKIKSKMAEEEITRNYKEKG